VRLYIIVALLMSLFDSSALAMNTLGSKQLKADRILVEKSDRRMTLLFGDKIIKTYKVSLGMQPLGTKIKRGDNKTPEGLYYIVGRKLKSQFHKSLRISYPNADDVERARKLGVDPGSDIMIHGVQNHHSYLDKLYKLRDWTRGCIAVRNHEIEEILNFVDDGTPIEILP